PRCRIEIGKLFNIARKDRLVLQARLYGSEPPALDSVWGAIRKKDIEVSVSARSSWNDREKEIDTKLTADAVDDIITYKKYASHSDSAVVIFSGDKDMSSTIRKAKQYKWNIEIWSFKKAICNEFVQDKQIQTFFIDNDDYFENVSFIVVEHRGRIPRDRSFVIRYSGLDTTKPKSIQTFTNSIVRWSSEIFRLPVMVRFNESIIILVVVCAQKRNECVIYDFTKDVWSNCDRLQEKIRQGFPSVTEIEFLTYVQYIQANVDLGCEVDDQNFPNDDECPVGHPDYPVDESFTTVLRKTRRSNQKFSTSCAFGFKCANGTKCARVHSHEEKEYFKTESSPARRYNYKTKLCYHNN
ncbi:hypothetical protein Bhyg_17250, partial [Pseudolycoriella hygida]